MGLRAFIKATANTIKKFSKNLKKGIRSVVTVLSPRTLPSFFTASHKLILGLSIFGTNALLNYISPEQEEDQTNLSNNIAAIFVVDSALDVVKVLIMVANQKYELSWGRKKLSISDQATMEGELQRPNDSVVMYKKILDATYFLSLVNDFTILFNTAGFIFPFFWIFGHYSWKEINEVLAEVDITQKISYWTMLGAVCSLALLGADMRLKMKQGSGSFGNQPYVGFTTAAIILSSTAHMKEGYNELFVTINDKYLVDLYEPSLFQSLTEYQTVADRLYLAEYQEVYKRYSSQFKTTTHARLDAAARKFAQHQLELFQNKGTAVLGVKISFKDVYEASVPYINFFAYFKLYKNCLVALENLLDLMDQKPFVNVKVNTSKKVLSKVKIPRQMKERRLRKVTSIKPAHSQPSASALREARSQARSALLLSQQSQALQSGTTPTELQDNDDEQNRLQQVVSHEDSSVTKVSKRRNSTVQPPPGSSSPTLVFTRPASKSRSRGDSKSNDGDPESPEIDTDKDKEEALKSQRKTEILSHYYQCNRALFRSILDRTVSRDISQKEILKLATALELEQRTLAGGGTLLLVYGQHGASFHPVHGKKETLDPRFFTDLKDAFDSVSITTDDLDDLDEQISQCACTSAIDVLRILRDAMTTRANLNKTKLR